MSLLPSATSRKYNVAFHLDNMPVGRVHWKVVIAVGLGLFFDLYEIFLAGSINIALGKEFAVSGLQLKLLLGSAFIGMFLGAAFLGRLADKIGRRRAFIINLIWYSAWSLIAAFSPNAWFLVFARFMAGIGVGAEYPVADAYLSDVLPKNKRGQLATWAYTSSFLAVPVVGFLALWLNSTPLLGIPGWRWLLALGGLGALGVLFMRRGLPESPRWLDSVGRTAEASASLEIFAKGSGINQDELARTAPPEEHTSRPAAKSAPKSVVARLKTEPYRKRFLMLLGFHLLQPAGYYGFGTLATLILVSSGHSVTSSLLFTALSFLGYPLGSLLSTPLVARFERKYLLIGSIAALAASGFAFSISQSDALIVVFGLLTTAISNIFSNVFHVYQAEIFPTSLRATAVGWTYSVSRISSAALPFVLLPVLEDFGAPVMFMVVAAALAVTIALVALLGPVTTRRSLTEINPA